MYAFSEKYPLPIPQSNPRGPAFPTVSQESVDEILRSVQPLGNASHPKVSPYSRPVSSWMNSSDSRVYMDPLAAPSGVIRDGYCLSSDTLTAFETQQFILLEDLVSRGSSKSNNHGPSYDASPEKFYDQDFTEEAHRARQGTALKGTSIGSPSGLPRCGLQQRTRKFSSDCVEGPAQKRTVHDPLSSAGSFSFLHVPRHISSRESKLANQNSTSRFSFNAEQTAPSPHKMYSHSAENISTTFSPNDWHGKFQAGDYFGGNSTSGVPRGRSSSRTAPKSPIKRRPLNRPRMSTSTHNSGSEADGQNPKFGTESSSSSGGTTFSPEEWAQTFKPQTFAPPVYPSPGIQSRNQSFSRGSSRRTRVGTPKPTTASKTAGTAAIVDDESSDDVKPLFSERPSSKGESTAAEDPVVPDISPQPMDIDPPVEPVSMPPNSQARNVPLEPSKPEWRAGDAKSATEQASLPPKNAEAEAEAGQEAKSTRRNTKSTDSEDFKTTLEDLKNIEPLHNPATGLNSFSDLTSDLPFPSKPALNVPISRNFSSGQLELPHPPKAPLMPAIPTTAKRPSQSSFQSYVLAFKAYMAEWDVFNTRILIHFVARKNQVDAMPPGWLEAFGESNYERYMEGLREDEKIRGWWDVACGKHQTAIADFKWLRDVMKGGIDAASANTNQL